MVIQTLVISSSLPEEDNKKLLHNGTGISKYLRTSTFLIPRKAPTLLLPPWLSSLLRALSGIPIPRPCTRGPKNVLSNFHPYYCRRMMLTSKSSRESQLEVIIDNWTLSVLTTRLTQQNDARYAWKGSMRWTIYRLHSLFTSSIIGSLHNRYPARCYSPGFYSIPLALFYW